MCVLDGEEHHSPGSDDYHWRAVSEACANAPESARIGIAIRDHAGGTWFSQNEDMVFKAASTVKLLILLALADRVTAQQTSLADRVEITPEQRVSGSGVLAWLDSASPLSVHDLAWLMIAVSDNTASNVLIDLVGLEAIDQVQRDLGLSHTVLKRHFMRPVPGGPHNFTCARDLVLILDAIAAHPRESAWMLSMLGDQQVTDRLARHLPDTVSFAGKSGWQTGISHDSGIFTWKGKGVTAAVLTEDFLDSYAAAVFIGSIGAAILTDVELATRTDGRISRRIES